MRAALLLSLALVIFVNADYNPNKNESPIWKVFCDNLYGGRLDSIVNPGTYSVHAHRVFGGSNFGSGKVGRSAVEQYNVQYSSPCTSCSIKSIDNSNYWTADLYYRWPNNTYSLVPSGGLTVYYLSRGGSTGTQRTDPGWKPIPKGLRMVAGTPTRRTYNDSLVAHQAINYVCLSYNGGGFDESSDWSGLKTNRCPNGLRTQVWFPMCWDGINLDSADHISHMSYPIQRKDGGDCPKTHPVRIPGVFFEHTFNVGDFPHGDGTNNFVWSMGDNTGYGHHGDFLSGWDEKVMAAAIADPHCSNENPDMAFGNNVRSCPPLAQYVKDGKEPKCLGLSNPVPLTENLGANRPLSRMPGCFDYNGPIANCDKTPAGSDNAGTYFIKSNNGKFWTAQKNGVVYANNTGALKSYPELWAFGIAPNNQITIQNQDNFGVISARANAQLVGGADTWEYWTKETVSAKTVAFKATRNGKYLTQEADGTLSFNAATISAAQTFELVDNDGGYVPGNDGFSELAAKDPLLTGPGQVATGGAGGAASTTNPDDLQGRNNAGKIAAGFAVVAIFALLF